MKFRNPIYPITDTGLSGLSLAEQTKLFISAEVDLVQLREKQMKPREFAEQAADALKFARVAGVKLIINDRVDIALAIGADGVHVGQDDLPPLQARRLLGKEAIIGYSTHSLKQAAAASKLPIDYIAFGPVFPTFTKDNPDEVTGVETLTAVKNTIGNIPLVAIGGIGPQNIAEVAASGASAAAVISAIYSEKSGIEKTVFKLRDIWLSKNVKHCSKNTCNLHKYHSE
jgi:thiamine-phosphate pyrophosphorylase